VWLLAAPFGSNERAGTIPAGKALFITLPDVKRSSFEAADSGFRGDTVKEQRACDKYWDNHIVNVFCEIDGQAVKNLSSYGVTSPQFNFTAPTPWLLGDTGGSGTSVGDGYYVFVAPLPPANTSSTMAARSNSRWSWMVSTPIFLST